MRIDRLCRGQTVFLLLVCIVFTSRVGAETWQFSADQVSSSQKGDSPKIELDGNAQVTSKNMVINAEHLVLEGEDYQKISGEDGVSLTDSDEGITVTSGRFDYERETEIIRFREQVTLVNEEKGIVIRCESLNLQDDNNLVIMQISVRLIKDETVCRGEFATYRVKDNLLEISGHPVVWRKNDEYRADRIRVNLDTDEIIMEGTVAGSLTTKTEEQNEE